MSRKSLSKCAITSKFRLCTKASRISVTSSDDSFPQLLVEYLSNCAIVGCAHLLKD